MNISAAGSNLFAENILARKDDPANVTVQGPENTSEEEKSLGADQARALWELADKLDISEEGIEKYRDSLIEAAKPFEDVLKEREDLLANCDRILGDKYTPFTTKYNEYRGNKSGISGGVEAAYRAFVEVYDKIMNDDPEYMDQISNLYFEDDSSPDGYRKLTKQDMLDALKRSYNKEIEYWEIQAELAPITIKALEDTARKLSKYAYQGSVAEVVDKYNMIADSMKKDLENLPEGFGGIMRAAGQAFLQNYSKGMDVNAYIKNSGLFWVKNGNG